MTSSIDTLLRAAQFLEEQELQEQLGTFYQPISIEKENISTDEIIAQVSVEAPIVESPIIVTTHPNVQYISEPITIDLPQSLPLPLTIPNGIINNVTLYNIDESHASLNLSTGSSGYSTSSIGNSSLNQSAPAEDLVVVELEKNVAVPEQFDENFLTQQQQQLSSFNPLQIPSSLLIGRRRTISSNSNSGILRSPSTVRAGTREVHNKLEKNRRAHLKECFESLKKQLPITADEKKTSNLSILGAAIRHIQFLRRKEREFEHEMERLAKEKISAQNRILFLKRELAQWDIDFSKLIPEPDINSIKSERAFTETSNEIAGKNGIKYSSTSSLSSITTASSACASNVASTTNLSPSLIHNTSITPSSPSSTCNILTSSVGGSSIMMLPMAFNSKQLLDDCPKYSNKPLKISSIATTSNQHSKNNILPLTSSNQLLSLKSSDILVPTPSGVTFSHCQTIPLNLHTTTLGTIHHTSKHFYGSKEPTPINGLKNGTKNFNVNEKYNKSCITSNINHLQTSVTTTTSKLDSNEPPTKLIKLINGSAILAPMDKDKMLHSGQLTLSQVVGGGGLVVSPIQLLNSSQGLRVIGQSNGLTTIELSTPQINNQQQQHRHIMGPQGTNVAQFQKLLMNGSATTTTHLSIPTIPQMSHQQQQFRLGPELSRLAGGAELNLLPNNTQPNTIYRGQSSKIAIINNNITMNESTNSNRIQMMQPTPIVVSHGQSANLTHIITTNSQIGKVITTTTTTNQNLQSGTQYLNKSMVVVNNDTSKNSSKSHN